MARFAMCVSAFLVTERPRLAPSSLIGRIMPGAASSDFAILTTDGSLMIGATSGETWREAGGGKGGLVAEVVRDRGTGRSAAAGGCTDATLERGGVAIDIGIG